MPNVLVGNLRGPTGPAGSGTGADEVLIAHEPDPTSTDLDLWVDLDMPSTGGSNYAWVVVVDPATDIRPGVQYVLWVGGVVKPVNMGVGDLWVKA
jgi:hypothetical protein